jgi:hypothetical protein
MERLEKGGRTMKFEMPEVQVITLGEEDIITESCSHELR